MTEDKFRTLPQNLDRLDERSSSQTKNLSLGVPFMDDALGGLPRSSLLVIGARSGVGKTQLVTQIAFANAAEGKRVHFFALEAEPSEIEGRMKYQLLAQYWRSRPELRAKHPNLHLSYRDWHAGLYRGKFDEVQAEITAFLKAAYSNLHTYYRDKNDFSIARFKKLFESVQGESDLIIIDHLHYFDTDDENENRSLKNIVKAIRDCGLLGGIPVILVAHLRKRDRMSKCLMPEIDEFHGSSDLTKIATDVVLLSPMKGGKNGHWATLMRVAKCRRDGEANRFMGVVMYSTQELKYDDKYRLSKFFDGQEELDVIQYHSDLPYWAKNASVSTPAAGGNIARNRKDLDD